MEDGKRSTFTVKVGDRILFSSYAGTEIVRRHEYLIMRETTSSASFRSGRLHPHTRTGTMAKQICTTTPRGEDPRRRPRSRERSR
jgi:hypothetical protein